MPQIASKVGHFNFHQWRLNVIRGCYLNLSLVMCIKKMIIVEATKTLSKSIEYLTYLR
jgi:hypothetical protein